MSKDLRLKVGLVGFIVFGIGLVGICGLVPGSDRLPYILPTAFGIAAMYLAGDKTEGIW